MSKKLKKTVIATALLSLTLASALVFILAFSLTRGISRPPLSRYFDASEVTLSKSEIAFMLEALGQTMNISDPTLLHERLAGLPQIQSPNDLIGRYTSNIVNLSGNLSKIQFGLKAARSNLASGNRNQALTLLGQLERQRVESDKLLQSSHSLLMRIGEQYQINITAQLVRLNTLNRLYDKYTAQISQLSSQLNTQAGLVPTALTFNSTALEVFVGQQIRVYGSLKTANGTALENKTITISWRSVNIAAESSLDGIFEANVSFPVGSPPGVATVTADYEPSGHDKQLYSASTAQIRLTLYYEPTAISTNIGPTTVRPLEGVYFWGNLSTVRGHQPLANRTIIVELDHTFLGNATTDNLGAFSFYFHVPMMATNGTHNVAGLFNSTNDVYAPSNATLPFTVEILATSVQLLVDHATVLSGTKLTMNGSVYYPNPRYPNQTAPPSGNVTIYIDNVPYANATLNDRGSFISTIQMALGTSYGSHSVVVKYQPDKPWIQTSETAVTLNVISLPIISMGIAATAVASVLATYLVKKNRGKAALRQGPPASPTLTPGLPGLSEEFSHSNLSAALGAQMDFSSKVRTAYALAQMLINIQLGLQTRDSETPSEYLHRIIEAAPSLEDSLGPIVNLFELTEYSSYPIEADHAKEVRERLLSLREKLETVRKAEDFKR